MPRYDSDVELGERYRDPITGFEGTATSTHFYLHGCERIMLERWSEEKGQMLEEGFDAPRLVRVTDGQQMTSARTGGPAKPMPRARPT